jgi:hypothetical protein
MEQRITITDLNSNTGGKILTFAQYVLSMVGTSTISSVLGTGGVIIPILSIIISLLIGTLQPDYNPVKQTISQLVHYPHGWFQTTDFLVLGVWLFIFAIKFYSAFTHKLTTKIAVFTIILLGVGFFLITIFPTNFPGSEKTIESTIHEKTAQLICTLFPICCCLMIPEFKANQYWKRFVTYTMVTAIIGFGLIGIGAVITIKDAPFLGLLERIIMLNAVIWLEVIVVYMIFQKSRKQNRKLKLNPFVRAFNQMTR